MKKQLAIITCVMLLAGALPARAEQIPAHLAAMAAQLYKQAEHDLKSAKLSPERKKVLEDAIKALQDTGVHRWSAQAAEVDMALPEVARALSLDMAKKEDMGMLNAFMDWRKTNGTLKALMVFEKQVGKPISDAERSKKAGEIDKLIDAAAKKRKNIYTGNPDKGRTVQMNWKPDSNKFFMKVKDDGSVSSSPFAAAITGDVASKLSEDGKEMALSVTPSESPFKAATKQDLEDFKKNVLGEWRDDKAGETYVFSASDQKVGDVLAPREVYDEQIEKLQEDVKSMKEKTIFKWKNAETGKEVKQETYRRLSEPYEFVGKEYALQGAEEKIAALEKQVEELRKERDGKKLTPVDQHDPAEFKDLSSEAVSKPITVTVKRDDGYSYTYDSAVFDGTRISAKRTYRKVEDVENEGLPQTIREQLISKGWNPPGWLDLEASIDAETGDMELEGAKWALHVTYSSFFGDAPEVDSIHTPHSYPRVLKQGGGAFESAEGAAKGVSP